MSCPNCGHTLEAVAIERELRIYHCPRCGTSRVFRGIGGPYDVVPALVTRCREFREHWPSLGAADADWSGHGIAESINLQENRP